MQAYEDKHVNINWHAGRNQAASQTHTHIHTQWLVNANGYTHTRTPTKTIEDVCMYAYINIFFNMITTKKGWTVINSLQSIPQSVYFEYHQPAAKTPSFPLASPQTTPTSPVSNHSPSTPYPLHPPSPSLSPSVSPAPSSPPSHKPPPFTWKEILKSKDT